LPTAHSVILIESLGSLLHKSRLEECDDLVEHGKDFWFTDQVRYISVLFLIVLEVSLIVHFFILGLSDFFDFVMVDVQLLSIEWLLMELLLCSLGSLWVLEADKCIHSFSFFWEDSDTFNLSMFGKKFLKLIRSCCWREVFDV